MVPFVEGILGLLRGLRAASIVGAKFQTDSEIGAETALEVEARDFHVGGIPELALALVEALAAFLDNGLPLGIR